MLPVDDNGLPDWDYMEKFIERLETRERERVMALLGMH